MNVNIRLKNAEEFQILLKKASTLSKQLDETLQQINGFYVETEAKLTSVAHSKCDNSGKLALGISSSPKD